ncbi:hypothetical protein [Halobacterium litoreum]|uniref:Sensor histidine kinase n=1 Tax=Halobacterium litoreum TaxID=2039234 RepID=A0ABD5NG96_9EURY|nr:hypothetical protein [Halobacterium litoreum]UHH12944.1 hypothetical protein LT972_12355 [Halobacterium litoreum]
MTVAVVVGLFVASVAAAALVASRFDPDAAVYAAGVPWILYALATGPAADAAILAVLVGALAIVTRATQS